MTNASRNHHPTDQDYMHELEHQLDLSKQKYQEIYNSVRTVDRAIFLIKSAVGPAYRCVRSLFKKDNDRPHTLELPYPDPFLPAENPTRPLKIIYTNLSIKRVNLVLDSLVSYPDLAKKQAIVEAVKQANRKRAAFRLITRNSLAMPTILLEVLEHEGVPVPKSYSFYSDTNYRLSPSVRRLEVGSDETFIYYAGLKKSAHS